MGAAYNPFGRRATEARANKIFNSFGVKIVLVILALALVGGGGALLYFHYPIGWLVASFAAWPVAILIWTKYELKNIPIGSNNTINDLLSNECLVRLGANPTPQSVAKWYYRTRSGNFMAMRYAITPNRMESITASMPSDMEPIFDAALSIREQTQSEVVSGAVLAVAIISCHPDQERILNSMKLDLNDLLNGIVWFNYLSGLVKGMHQKRHTGGFARDLMFGYTPLLQRYAVNISAFHRKICGECGGFSPHLCYFFPYSNSGSATMLISGSII